MVSYAVQIKMRNMGETRNPQLVTPIVAVLAGHAAYVQMAKAPLERLFGPIQFTSPVFPFEKTAYYAPTMGEGLRRQFLTFKRLADPSPLAEWKHSTNRIEEEIGTQLAAAPVPSAPIPVPSRPINLDIGYISGPKLVLASTKDFSHRIYLRDGIFAEITMCFRGNRWVSHKFTFPDYSNGTYDAFLKKVRDHHIRKVKEFKRLNPELL